MNEDQRERWRRVLAARNARQRTRRGKRATGIAIVRQAGMVRRLPTKDVPASGGAAPKE